MKNSILESSEFCFVALMVVAIGIIVWLMYRKPKKDAKDVKHVDLNQHFINETTVPETDSYPVGKAQNVQYPKSEGLPFRGPANMPRHYPEPE